MFLAAVVSIAVGVSGSVLEGLHYLQRVALGVVGIGVAVGGGRQQLACRIAYLHLQHVVRVRVPQANQDGLVLRVTGMRKPLVVVGQGVRADYSAGGIKHFHTASVVVAVRVLVGFSQAVVGVELLLLQLILRVICVNLVAIEQQRVLRVHRALVAAHRQVVKIHSVDGVVRYHRVGGRMAAVVYHADGLALAQQKLLEIMHRVGAGEILAHVQLTVTGVVKHLVHALWTGRGNGKRKAKDFGFLPRGWFGCGLLTGRKHQQAQQR